MTRRVYIVASQPPPADAAVDWQQTPTDEEIQQADASQCGEIAIGVPSSLEVELSDVELPYVYTEETPDPPSAGSPSSTLNDLAVSIENSPLGDTVKQALLAVLDAVRNTAPV